MPKELPFLEKIHKAQPFSRTEILVMRHLLAGDLHFTQLHSLLRPEREYQTTLAELMKRPGFREDVEREVKEAVSIVAAAKEEGTRRAVMAAFNELVAQKERKKKVPSVERVKRGNQAREARAALEVFFPEEQPGEQREKQMVMARILAQRCLDEQLARLRAAGIVSAREQLPTVKLARKKEEIEGFVNKPEFRFIK